MFTENSVSIEEFRNYVNKNFKRDCVIYDNGDIDCESLNYVDLAMTYARLSGVCAYCGKKLKLKNSKGKKNNFGVSTADHIVPKARGGLSLISNLCCSCNSCNSKKGFMTDDEFFEYRELIKAGKIRQAKEFKDDIELEMQANRLKGIYLVGDSWDIEDFPLKEVKLSRRFSELESIQSKRSMKYYKIYRHLRKPILISSNRVIIEGFGQLYTAVKNKLTTVPVVFAPEITCIDDARKVEKL